MQEAVPRLDEAESAAADQIGAAYGTPQDAAEEAYWEEYRSQIVQRCGNRRSKQWAKPRVAFQERASRSVHAVLAYPAWQGICRHDAAPACMRRTVCGCMKECGEDRPI